VTKSEKGARVRSLKFFSETLSISQLQMDQAIITTQIDKLSGDDVDLATCRLTHHDLCKEIDELGAGVACAGFSQHLSGF
jgi:hypothetical protein